MHSTRTPLSEFAINANSSDRATNRCYKSGRFRFHENDASRARFLGNTQRKGKGYALIMHCEYRRNTRIVFLSCVSELSCVFKLPMSGPAQGDAMYKVCEFCGCVPVEPFVPSNPTKRLRKASAGVRLDCMPGSISYSLKCFPTVKGWVW